MIFWRKGICHNFVLHGSVCELKIRFCKPTQGVRRGKLEIGKRRVTYTSEEQFIRKCRHTWGSTQKSGTTMHLLNLFHHSTFSLWICTEQLSNILLVKESPFDLKNHLFSLDFWYVNFPGCWVVNHVPNVMTRSLSRKLSAGRFHIRIPPGKHEGKYQKCQLGPWQRGIRGFRLT